MGMGCGLDFFSDGGRKFTGAATLGVARTTEEILAIAAGSKFHRFIADRATLFDGNIRDGRLSRRWKERECLLLEALGKGRTAKERPTRTRANDHWAATFFTLNACVGRFDGLALLI